MLEWLNRQNVAAVRSYPFYVDGRVLSIGLESRRNAELFLKAPDKRQQGLHF